MSKLTGRQRQILDLAKAHYPPSIIARMLGVDLRTVHSHLANAAQRRQWKHWRDFVPPFPADKLPVDLPPRQRQALLGVMQGKTSKEIAREMVVTDGTVRTAIWDICQRYQVHSRYDLAEVILKEMYREPNHDT